MNQAAEVLKNDVSQSTDQQKEILVEVKNLTKYYPVKGGILSRVINNVKAVDGVDFFIRQGETLGVVGESGCGKTTLGRTMLNLIPPTKGEVFFEGTNIYSLKGNAMKKLRQNMQIVFQDPFGSLNPRMTVGDMLSEALRVHKIIPQRQIPKRVVELLNLVGLSDYHVGRYPHEFSGGQRQRIGVARALTLNPKFIVCDEPVSALDVSIQSQVLNLLEDLQQELGLTYLFIAHDLSVVKHISDRIAVMYLGKMVEMTNKHEMYNNPLHPYTQALLSAVPIPNPELQREKIVLKGDVPSPIDPPSGCRFHTRCAYAEEECKVKEPLWREVKPDHFTACHFAERFVK